MANFFRTGPDINAAMAAEVAPDQPPFGTYIEGRDTTNSFQRFQTIESPHLAEIEKFTRD